MYFNLVLKILIIYGNIYGIILCFAYCTYSTALLYTLRVVVEAEPRSSEEAEYLDSASSCTVLAEYIGTGLGFLCQRKEAAVLRRAAKLKGIKFKFLTRFVSFFYVISC